MEKAQRVRGINSTPAVYKNTVGLCCANLADAIME